ncbi:MAG: hypothetical protein AB1791_00235 [Chloroflexota bacterium]
MPRIKVYHNPRFLGYHDHHPMAPAGAPAWMDSLRTRGVLTPVEEVQP